jgi:hypothetical protein
VHLPPQQLVALLAGDVAGLGEPHERCSHDVKSIGAV